MIYDDLDKMIGAILKHNAATNHRTVDGDNLIISYKCFHCGALWQMPYILFLRSDSLYKRQMWSDMSRKILAIKLSYSKNLKETRWAKILS